MHNVPILDTCYVTYTPISSALEVKQVIKFLDCVYGMPTYYIQLPSIIYCKVRGNKIVGEPLPASPRALAADYLALRFASKRTIIYQNKR